jgi:chaperone modulatory protein CbpM
MSQTAIITGVLIEETTSYTFKEVCQRYHMPEELLLEMLEHGLFEALPTPKKDLALDQKALKRIEAAFRIHNDLGVNLEGVALALDLLEQLETLKQELAVLRHHF